MSERKQIGKKLRFDVFKRDSFTCQYCGSTPPKVILHVDHIMPVASGGGNEIENLITACSCCNLGKGASHLGDIPKALKERSEEIAEREAQIAGYNEILRARAERIEDSAWEVAAALENTDSVESYDIEKLRSIKIFLEKLPLQIVLDSAEIASSRSIRSDNKKFRYFCGICWNRVRDEFGE